MPNNGQITSEVDFESLPEEQQAAIINGHTMDGDNSNTSMYDKETSEDEETPVEDEVEADETSPSEETPVEQTQTEKKNPSNVQKLLGERSELRAEVARLNAIVDELVSKWGDRTDQEDLALVDAKADLRVLTREQQLAEQHEQKMFYEKYPTARNEQDALSKVLEEFPTMSYENAWKYYLMNSWRLSEVSWEKPAPKAQKFWMSWWARTNAAKAMTTADFEAQAEAAFKQWKRNPFSG